MSNVTSIAGGRVPSQLSRALRAILKGVVGLALDVAFVVPVCAGQNWLDPEPGLAIESSLVYMNNQGKMAVKETGQTFESLVRLRGVFYKHVGSATVVTSALNNKTYAVPHLVGSGLFLLYGDDLRWIEPGTCIKEESEPFGTAKDQTVRCGPVWTGTGFRWTFYVTAKDGTAVRDTDGRPKVEERCVMGHEAGGWGPGPNQAFRIIYCDYSWYSFPTLEDCRRGIVSQDVLVGESEWYRAEYAIDHQGYLIRVRPARYFPIKADKDEKSVVEAEPFVVVNSLMADSARLSKGQEVGFHVLIDEEPCVERYRYDGKDIRRDLIHKSGTETLVLL